MRLASACSAAALFLIALPAAAQQMDHSNHAGHDMSAKPAAASRLNLDTPIEAIVADPAGKAALETGLPGITSHPSYDMFKAMSLKQLQPMAEGQITAEALAKVEAELVKIK